MVPHFQWIELMSAAGGHSKLDQPWTRPHSRILENLEVSVEQGLDPGRIQEMRGRYGRNRLKKAEKKSAWRILLNQFKSLIIFFLAIAAAVSFFLEEWVDGVAITVAIVLNAAIGFISELRAARSMEALHEFETTTAAVRRGGKTRTIPSEEIVSGDIVLVQSGDMIPADIRLISTSAQFQVNESALTGESLPVEKNPATVERDTPLGNRSNMLYKGTSVTKGSGEGIVVAVGMNTELGNIASMAEEAEEEITPLENRLNRLGQKLIYVIGFIAIFVLAVGVLTGKPIYLMYKVAVSLAVAAIPEGLPIVATIALARGMWRMARQNALVNRLSSVETLGATTVIFTDKTGTLTENEMTLTRISLESAQVRVRGKNQFLIDNNLVDVKEEGPLRDTLEVGMLCNNAYYDEREGDGVKKMGGDPVEVALLVAGAKAGLSRSRLLEKYPKEREEPFDAETKKMATYHLDGDGGYFVAVKGAPEELVRISSKVRTARGIREMDAEDRKSWSEYNRELAEDGLRVLAIASKTIGSLEAPPYEDLTFLGLVGLWDPPREEIKGAIDSCRKAGIRVIMVTGDHAITAKKVGEAVGLVSDGNAVAITGGDIKDRDRLSENDLHNLLSIPIFARVSPKQKLDLITLHQENGAIVAMTGDGVNDAPALKKADIGVAMGKRGTQVAREAADIVLMDDAFLTIVHAIQMGRIIFANIRKFVLYLLSGNVSEIMIVSLALLAGAPLPILPLQILYLNMLSDVFPALALGVGQGSHTVMERKPRAPNEPIMTRAHWIATGVYSVFITSAVLGVFAVALVWLDMGEEQAVSLSFLTLAFARLWHVFNMRDADSRFFKNDITQNPFVWGALGLCTALLLFALYSSYLSSVLKLVNPGTIGWSLILSGSVMPIILGQFFLRITHRLRRSGTGQQGRVSPPKN